MTQNTETYVTVRPDLTWTDETTRNIPPERRNCLFADEQLELDTHDAARKYGKPFQLTNCLNRCHESYLVQLCNCSLPIFFLYNSRGKSSINKFIPIRCDSVPMGLPSPKSFLPSLNFVAYF